MAHYKVLPMYPVYLLPMSPVQTLNWGRTGKMRCPPLYYGSFLLHVDRVDLTFESAEFGCFVLIHNGFGIGAEDDVARFQYI